MEGNSILEIARGEILECIDGQMQAIWENILDTETEATVTRKLTVTILLTPDTNRETVGVRSVTKAQLAPRETAQRRLCITENGKQAVEIQSGVPGQMGLDGNTQAAGIKLRIRKAAARMEERRAANEA